MSMKATLEPTDASGPPPRACSTSPTRPPTRPSGRCCWRATPRGLVRVGLPNQDADELLVDLAERVSPRVLEAPAALDEARRELDLYFAGKLDDFDLPIDWQPQRRLPPARPRQIAAHPLRRDPQLHARSPAAPATSARSAPPAPPAASNPIPLVVPCHRVLRSGGGLGGYGGGLPMKEALLRAGGRAGRKSARLKDSRAGPIYGPCDASPRDDRRARPDRDQARLVASPSSRPWRWSSPSASPSPRRPRRFRAARRAPVVAARRTRRRSGRSRSEDEEGWELEECEVGEDEEAEEVECEEELEEATPPSAC